MAKLCRDSESTAKHPRSQPHPKGTIGRLRRCAAALRKCESPGIRIPPSLITELQSICLRTKNPSGKGLLSSLNSGAGVANGTGSPLKQRGAPPASRGPHSAAQKPRGPESLDAGTQALLGAEAPLEGLDAAALKRSFFPESAHRQLRSEMEILAQLRMEQEQMETCFRDGAGAEAESTSGNAAPAAAGAGGERGASTGQRGSGLGGAEANARAVDFSANTRHLISGLAGTYEEDAETLMLQEELQALEQHWSALSEKEDRILGRQRVLFPHESCTHGILCRMCHLFRVSCCFHRLQVERNFRFIQKNRRDEGETSCGSRAKSWRQIHNTPGVTEQTPSRNIGRSRG